jgi:YfiR/HmsC-like
VRAPDPAAWRLCHLLFVKDSELRRSDTGLRDVATFPVLAVSDGKDFLRSGGIIEFFLDGERLRFAINVDAVERSGLRLSSRLLGLATVVRTTRVQ